MTGDERSSRLSWLVGSGVAAALIVVLVVVLMVTSSNETESELGARASIVTSSEESGTPTTAAVFAGDVAEAADNTFQVTMPEGWRSVRPETEFLLTLYSPNDDSNMLVNINPADTRGVSIKESADAMLSQIKLQFGGDIVVDAGGVEVTTVAGEPAVRYTYSFVGEQKARGRQFFVRHNDIEYVLTFTGTPETFDGYAADYAQIQNSWTWTE